MLSSIFVIIIYCEWFLCSLYRDWCLWPD